MTYFNNSSSHTLDIERTFCGRSVDVLRTFCGRSASIHWTFSGHITTTDACTNWTLTGRSVDVLGTQTGRFVDISQQYMLAQIGRFWQFLEHSATITTCNLRTFTGRSSDVLWTFIGHPKTGGSDSFICCTANHPYKAPPKVAALYRGAPKIEGTLWPLKCHKVDIKQQYSFPKRLIQVHEQTI